MIVDQSKELLEKLRAMPKKPWPPYPVRARIVESLTRPDLVSIRAVSGGSTDLKRELTNAGFQPGDLVEIYWVREMNPMKKETTE